MTYQDLDIARGCHAALKKIFFARAGGCADEEALLQVEELCWGATRAVDDAECREKIFIIASCAAALFSDSEHRKWDQGSRPGAEVLRLKILRALISFHRRIYRIEALRRAGGADAARAQPRPATV